VGLSPAAMNGHQHHLGVSWSCFLNKLVSAKSCSRHCFWGTHTAKSLRHCLTCWLHVTSSLTVETKHGLLSGVDDSPTLPGTKEGPGWDLVLF
jgi:hypothetical protein